ncbi:rhomboid family intramembrane serine protease [Candidatus Amoebophilus asiaticus]|nr:rhomboid family intramembrane serine protease [Candidatus Amoebophilus asiaticus]
MFSSFFDDIKHSFKQKDNGLIQLILINIAVYIAVNLLDTILFLTGTDKTVYNEIIRYLAVPASLKLLIFRPWTIITYMFLQESFWHILFNMLWLYWLGKILHEYLGNKKLISIYVLGGISGGLLYIFAFNVLPVFREVLPSSYALGASAGVLAVIVAVATLIPNYAIHLLFIGPVKLKYIAIFSVVLDLLSISKGNAGGHIAHLGGAIFGYFYIIQLQKGNDIGKGFQNLLYSLIKAFSRKGNLRVTYKNTHTENHTGGSKKPSQDAIDLILDKIAKSGYDSLSKEEKELLFRASNDKK